MIQLYVRNQSTAISDSDVKDIIAALQIQVTRDFLKFWPIADVTLNFIDKAAPEVPGIWELVFLDDSDQAGTLGYHDLTSSGDPLGKAFVKDDLKYGSKVSVTASHELLEMLVDPSINLCAQDDATGKFYALEVCDACEGDEFGYEILLADGKKITVSDFVTPRWFESTYDSTAQYDFQKVCTKELQLLEDGYISVNDGGGWRQVTGQLKKKSLAQTVAKPGHRRERRQRGRTTWRKSERPVL